MHLGLILSSNDPDILWNAVRFANFCLEKGEDVTIFLNAHAVEYHKVDSPRYELEKLFKTFALSEGRFLV
ncbi:MAG: hypothetical protein A2Y80_04155 [Deltaproteobacteria bacterium RBG_13_58_19]|nr:MAG: hypothetical protein A2Y80_04155 [Deltaproteobacteria bacterium RBG_13_58_19]